MNEDVQTLEELAVAIEVCEEARLKARENPEEAQALMTQAGYMSWRYVVQRLDALKRWEWAQRVRAFVDPPADDFVGIVLLTSGVGPDGRPGNKTAPHWEKHYEYGDHRDTIGVGADWQPLNWDLVSLFSKVTTEAHRDLIERLYGIAKRSKIYLPTPQFDVGNQGFYWVDTKERLTLALWLDLAGMVKMAWQEPHMGADFVDPSDDQIADRMLCVEKMLDAPDVIQALPERP